jgi:hypothetical protein
MSTTFAGQAVQAGPGIFTVDETAALTKFFAHARRSKQGEHGVAALPALIKDDAELAEKIAAFSLEVVQQRLPQWGPVYKDGELVYARELKPVPARRVVVVPRHLFTINWAYSGPGIPWPEAYHATFIPGFDRYIVTASRDSDDMHRCCDNAIGWFDTNTDWTESAKTIVSAWWAMQQGCGQEGWVDLRNAGSFGAANAHALREAIWPRRKKATRKMSRRCRC